MLKFMSGKIAFLAHLNLKIAKFLDIFILLYILMFMLNGVEHEICFTTSGPGCFLLPCFNSMHSK